MTTSVEETLTQLKQRASDAELDQRSAHFEAERLATLADDAGAHAEATKFAARKAFDEMGRLSDRAEEAIEAYEACRESIS